MSSHARSLRSVDPTRLQTFIAHMPKTVLHVHIEGTLEPELAFAMAQRNGIEQGSKAFPYAKLDDLRAAYRFDDLGQFLDVYYAVAGAILNERDFHDLAEAYAQRLIAQQVRVAEIFFDPQTHTSRGIAMSTVVRGLWSGLQPAIDAGIHVRLIACLLRDAPVGEAGDAAKDRDWSGASLSEATAWATLGQVLDHNRHAPADRRIVGLGLDSYEAPYPPELFTEVFARARSEGLLPTAHAGEEGPPAYIWTSLRELKVTRIDHGVRSTEDPALLEFLATAQDGPEVLAAYGEPHRIPLTVCPRSNLELKVFPDPTESNLFELQGHGVLVCINSDDPAYFGGYADANYLAIIEWLDPTLDQLRQLALGGIDSAWLPPEAKQPLRDELEAYFASAPQALGL
ncbi:MAG: adenosine deaminase family protein [Myxococcota bacterium]